MLNKFIEPFLINKKHSSRHTLCRKFHYLFIFTDHLTDILEVQFGGDVRGAEGRLGAEKGGGGQWGRRRGGRREIFIFIFVGAIVYHIVFLSQTQTPINSY